MKFTFITRLMFHTLTKNNNGFNVINRQKMRFTRGHTFQFYLSDILRIKEHILFGLNAGDKQKISSVSNALPTR